LVRLTIRNYLASIALALLIWLTINPLITLLSRSFSPLMQAARLSHGLVGTIFLGFLALYYPLHILLKNGFSISTAHRIIKPAKGIGFIVLGYLLLSRLWEIQRFLSLPVLGLLWAAYEATHRRQPLWKKVFDIALTVVYMIWAIHSTRDELIRIIIFSLSVYTIFKISGSLFSLFAGDQEQSLPASGNLVFYSFIFMVIFSGMMVAGANAGKYNPYLTTMDYFHHATAFLFLGLVLLHVTLTSRKSRAAGQRLLVHWPAVAGILALCVMVDAAHYWYYIDWKSTSLPAPDGQPVLVSKYSDLKGYYAPGMEMWFLPTAKSCSSERCHQAVSRQHDLSAHGRSFENQAFKTELEKFINQRGRPAADYCLACHAPLGVIKYPGDGSRGTVVDPLTTRDAAFTVGVDCVVCHRATPEKERAKIGNASLTIRPYWLERERYFGEDRDAGQDLFKALLSGKVALHQRTMRIKKNDWDYICGACHVVQLPTNISTDGQQRLIADHYLSFVDSVFARKGLSCASCHQQRFASYEINYLSYSHNYLGSGSSLPYADAVQDRRYRDLSLAFLRGLGDIALDVEEPVDLPPCIDDLESYFADHVSDHIIRERGADNPFRGINGQSTFRSLLETKVAIKRIGDKAVEVEVSTRNACVGHTFPPGGGIRAYLMVQAKDAEGRIIGLHNGLDPEGRPLDDATNLGIRTADSHGRLITDRRFWDAVNVVREKRIAPGERVKNLITIPISSGRQPASIEAEWYFLRQEALRSINWRADEKAAPVLIGKGAIKLETDTSK